ncbi:MAG: thiolase family protein [Dehalococcoidia bacterium]|nr:thiolase family protein [Dehalococcoidia bacterium]
MGNIPLHDVAVVGVYNTKQARSLEGHTSRTITVEAIRGALDDAGMTLSDIDGLCIGGIGSRAFGYEAGLRHTWAANGGLVGVSGVLEAAAAISNGIVNTVLIASGSAGVYTQRESTAPWTRPSNEFVECWGLFTAAEFALVARRHMERYGTTPHQLATVAATIRNNGNINPGAVYYGRGPFTPEDVLNSRMIADPYHLLDCAMTSEGGGAMILTRADRAQDRPKPPVYVLGGGMEGEGPAYQHPPSYDMLDETGVGAAKRAFRMAGITPNDVDVCEFYDNFSWEVIRMLEVFGFCGQGEGGPFVESGAIQPGGKFPIVTDGGLMSFSHSGNVQRLQRIIQAVRQVRGDSVVNQVPNAHVAITNNGGAGALYTDVLLVGDQRP